MRRGNSFCDNFKHGFKRAIVLSFFVIKSVSRQYLHARDGHGVLHDLLEPTHQASDIDPHAGAGGTTRKAWRVGGDKTSEFTLEALEDVIEKQ